MSPFRFALFVAFSSAALAADLPEPKFRAVTIDDSIQIGYGLAIADVDGDKLPDILLADKTQIVWYRNPGPAKPGATEPAPQPWEKFVIAEKLTPKDNVCLAAQDIDGDGKCEIAVGAEWNPGDTVNSGAVFYLIPPADRTQRWTPVKLHAEPTTHRMQWLEYENNKWGLVVAPLHGRGNKNGEGAPVKVLLYRAPERLNDPKAEWVTEVADESMHMTHNFRPLKTGFLLAGKEGVAFSFRDAGKWLRWPAIPPGNPVWPTSPAGEIDMGEMSLNRGFFATVEPMHGNQLVVYTQTTDLGPGRRQVLTDKLVEGHALRCGNLGAGGDTQIVVGWRGTPGKEGSTTGVAIWSPLDPQGEKWRETVIDPDGMACEDLRLADLNGDGKLDIVASGRATRNVKIYFNETTAP